MKLTLSFCKVVNLARILHDNLKQKIIFFIKSCISSSFLFHLSASLTSFFAIPFLPLLYIKMPSALRKPTEARSYIQSLRRLSLFFTLLLCSFGYGPFFSHRNTKSFHPHSSFSLPGVRAEMVGIDLGSEFVKLAKVQSGPSRGAPIEIVLNEQTRRKTPNVVGFRNSDLYVGENAKALCGRFPQHMAPMMNRIVGESFDSNGFTDEKESENGDSEAHPHERTSLKDWFSRDLAFTNQIERNPARNTFSVVLPAAPSPFLPTEENVDLSEGTSEETSPPASPNTPISPLPSGIHPYDPETLLGFLFSYLYDLTKAANLHLPSSPSLSPKPRAQKIKKQKSNQPKSFSKESEDSKEEFHESFMAPQMKNIEAALVVPYFFNTRQREGLVHAAALGGIAVNAILHTTTAVALHYGVQNRGLGNASLYFMVFDMGASRTEAGIYHYEPPEPGAPNAEAFGTLRTVSLASDRFLGTRLFDRRLAEVIAAEFTAKTKIKIDLSLGAKASVAERKGSASLLRAANGLREVLSANRYAPVTVESIVQDRDFSTTITRELFESKCVDLFERARRVAEKALQRANLSPDDLASLEIHGGGVRMPKILDDLAQFYGKPVDRTLNGDESAALGAAFYAAKRSGMFSARGFRIEELNPHSLDFVVSDGKAVPESAEPMAEENSEIDTNSVLGDDTKAAVAKGKISTPRTLFVGYNSSYPSSRKTITLHRTEDFSVSFREDKRLENTVTLSPIHDALTSWGYFDPELSHPDNKQKVQLETRIGENGILDVSQAELVFNQWRNISRMVRKRAVAKPNQGGEQENSEMQNVEKGENQKDSALSENNSAVSQEKTTSDVENEVETMKTNEEPATKESNSSVQSDNSSAKDFTTPTDLNNDLVFEREYKLELTEHRTPLNLIWTYSFPQPLSSHDRIQTQSFLHRQLAYETHKRKTAAAKNDLEALLLDTLTEWIPHHRTYGFIKKHEEEPIRTIMEDIKAWLEEGDGCTMSVTHFHFEEKIREVHAEKEKIEERKRPKREEKTMSNETAGNGSNASQAAPSSGVDGNDTSTEMDTESVSSTNSATQKEEL